VAERPQCLAHDTRTGGNGTAQDRCSGGAGHGKTQTLQHLIAADLSSPDPPSLIIIDSHGDMLSAIQRLDVFDPDRGRLTDRLIIVDPEDVEHPPALNMFDMGSQRLTAYTPAQREQVEAATIELYDYIFRALSARKIDIVQF
jgi:hypothetical protein